MKCRGPSIETWRTPNVIFKLLLWAFFILILWDLSEIYLKVKISSLNSNPWATIRYLCLRQWNSFNKFGNGDPPNLFSLGSFFNFQSKPRKDAVLGAIS